MTVRSQLYLLQLEDYDLRRFRQWIVKNPDREVLEKKSQIKWTPKAKILFILGTVTGSVETVALVISPLDGLFKGALLLVAHLKLLLFHHRLMTIGVTGSWGKTTVKDQLAAVLATRYKVYKTAGNNNTLLGVAKNVLKMPAITDIFICEMGAYHPGDIKAICDLVRPEVGIITTIGPMHLERFGSVERIRTTKYELFDSLPPHGLKIGPGDDLLVKICSHFRIPLSKAKQAIAILPPSPHRLEVLENNGLTIIDDSYNSNPAGFLRALDKLKKTPGKPKILVTPGMIELGEMQFAENEKAAIASAKVADQIIVVGNTNRQAWESGLGKHPNKYYVADIEEAKAKLAKIAKPSAVVLLENDLPDQYS